MSVCLNIKFSAQIALLIALLMPGCDNQAQQKNERWGKFTEELSSMTAEEQEDFWRRISEKMAEQLFMREIEPRLDCITERRRIIAEHYGEITKLNGNDLPRGYLAHAFNFSFQCTNTSTGVTQTIDDWWAFTAYDLVHLVTTQGVEFSDYFICTRVGKREDVDSAMAKCGFRMLGRLSQMKRQGEPL